MSLSVVLQLWSIFRETGCTVGNLEGAHGKPKLGKKTAISNKWLFKIGAQLLQP